MAKSAIQKITLNQAENIPFDKLFLSQKNVRRIKNGVSIEDLAADIARAEDRFRDRLSRSPSIVYAEGLPVSERADEVEEARDARAARAHDRPLVSEEAHALDRREEVYADEVGRPH